MSTSAAVPPGWNPDPADPFGKLRWWDGTQWTEHTVAAQSAPGQSTPAAPAYPQQQAYAPQAQGYAPQAQGYPPQQQQAYAPAWAQPPGAPAPAPSLQMPGAPAAADGMYRLRLSRVTSVIIMTHRQYTTYTGTYEQLAKAYKKHLIHNLLLGWWGIPWGLVRTPTSLSNNARAMRELKALAGRS